MSIVRKSFSNQVRFDFDKEGYQVLVVLLPERGYEVADHKYFKDDKSADAWVDEQMEKNKASGCEFYMSNDKHKLQEAFRRRHAHPAPWGGRDTQDWMEKEQVEWH